jgi:dihydropteroate synthase
MTPAVWHARARRIDVARYAVMGVLNMTPDSFLAESRCASVAEAVTRATAMLADGAAIVDVGGESTRPGAPAVAADEECRRVVPVIAALASTLDVAIAVDTRNPAVARAALDAGAHIVNDVSGCADPAMQAAVRGHGAGIVVMQMQGEPATMQAQPLDAGTVMPALHEFFHARGAVLAAAGIARAQIVLDPGIGFGKTFAANERIVRELATLAQHGQPILIGASRKRFIGERTGRAPAERLAGSLAVQVLAYAHGARIIRTHDVRATRDALEMAACCC